jgi:hypothetical protein
MTALTWIASEQAAEIVELVNEAGLEDLAAAVDASDLDQTADRIAEQEADDPDDYDEAELAYAHRDALDQVAAIRAALVALAEKTATARSGWWGSARRLVGRDQSSLAMSGFGAEVREALDRRADELRRATRGEHPRANGEREPTCR